MIYILATILLIIHSINIYQCIYHDDSKLIKLLIAIWLSAFIAWTSIFLSREVTRQTLIKLENKEIHYEVSSINSNTGEVLDIKFID